MNFDTNKYKVWTWKHPFLLHWMINPGLVINELILGQTVPRISLIEKSKKPLAERSFVPCPHCGTIHSGLKWSLQNKTAFGNWFGLYCDSCKKIIPPLRNLTSLLILAVTAPLWIAFYKPLKSKWLAKQAERFSKPLDLTTPEYNWVSQGLSWGFFMFLWMQILFPLFEKEPVSFPKIIFGLIWWTLFGLLFGYINKKLFFRTVKKQRDAQNAV